MGSTIYLSPPITNKRAKLALIHVAKKDLGLADDEYRTVLYAAAGVESASELKHESQFNDVMKAFENLGFKSVWREKKKRSRPAWADRWRCSEAQRAKIEVLWKRCARNPSEEALRAFVKRIVHVDNPAWMDVKLAQKVIFALESMAKAKDRVKG